MQTKLQRKLSIFCMAPFDLKQLHFISRIADKIMRVFGLQDV
jgi:hypothetical protein